MFVAIRSSPDFVQFGTAHTPLLRRGVAKPDEPSDSPSRPNQREDIERCSPTVAHLKWNNQKGAQSSTHLHGHGKKAEGASSFVGWEPCRDAGCGIRKGTCFTGAE